TEGVAVSLKAVRDKVVGLSKGVKVLKERGQIELTDRQMKIVELLIQKEKISIGNISKEFNITRQAALKEMNKLIDLKVIQLKGLGRGAHYILL
ncbi:MAG: HTH domain-containing protein, partial [Actinobacteria bacterium]|nr:HTH domain-containing protein [Actinomycetota bacterium]